MVSLLKSSDDRRKGGEAWQFESALLLAETTVESINYTSRQHSTKS